MTDPLRVSAVLVQYDREKHRGAVERLITLVDGLPEVESCLVVVDNACPGDWFHEITPRLVHLGGDNSAWEFSAFDHGLEFLEATGRTADVYVFATDACRAYGDDYLDLIDARVVRSSLELEAMIGWVDGFGPALRALGFDYRFWMRTSLFVMPASILRHARPFAYPLDEQRIFGPGPETPFRRHSAVSRELQEHLLAWLTTSPTSVRLEETWHSRFDLTPESFDFFRAKVCAILREQLLSARLRALGIPCFDFRLVADLEARKRGPMSAEERLSWQWEGWREARPPYRFWLQRQEVPRRIEHGEKAELVLEGWLVADPPVRDIRVAIGEDFEIESRCDIPRPDVLEVHPGYPTDCCGFEIRVPLEGLAPGVYAARLQAPQVGLDLALGRLRVAPRREFSADGVFIPRRAPGGSDLPVSVDGTFRSSRPLEKVAVLWNGGEAGLRAEWIAGGRSANGLRSYQVTVSGAAPRDESRARQTLELLFQTADGETCRWRTAAAVRLEEAPPYALSRREVGPWNPRTGRTSVRLEGAVAVAEEDSSLVFSRRGRQLLEEPLGGRPSHGVVRFEIARELADIPPGTATFGLALKGRQGPPRLLERWRSRVVFERPRVRVDRFEVRAPRRGETPYTLCMGGWVENHRGIDELELQLDGERRSAVPLDLLRPDVADYLRQPLSCRQGFLVELPLETGPGEHLLKLVLRVGDGEVELWERSITLGPPTAALLRIDSEDLADLVEGRGRQFGSAICIEGDVVSCLDALQATLIVGDEVAVRRPVAAGERFALHHAPIGAGAAPVRVVFDRRGETLYDTGPLDASFEPPPQLDRLGAALAVFVERFDLAARLGLGSTERLIHLLLEKNRSVRAAYSEMLFEISRRLAGGPRRAPGRGREGGDTGKPGGRGLDRSLRVLLASWEPPSLRHGGGVWIVNLLKELSRRHEVTVIHGHAEGEDAWVEEARPYARKVVGVLRPPPRRRSETGEGPVLGYRYLLHHPELREAVETELGAGDYDLVDYQYAEMLAHRARVDLPRALTVFEEPFSALLASCGSGGTSDAEKLGRLDEALSAFYLGAVALPREFPHLIAVTEADAEMLRRYQTESVVHVNGVGIDTARLAPPGSLVAGPGRVPEITFLGNYRHPPSVDAALYLAERILPRLRRLHPEVELTVIGNSPPPEVEELGRREGVRVTGFVEDFRPYLWRSSAFVAPIFSGAGMRVKVLEAMACAVPVVASPLAMSGIAARDGEHYFEAASEDEFVAACRRIFDSPGSAAAIGRRGRELVVAGHGVEAMAREREAIWGRILEGRAAGSSSSGAPAGRGPAAGDRTERRRRPRRIAPR